MTGQTTFTQALLDPNLGTPSGLIDPKGRPAGKRFDVYRNNVVVSLIDAMQEAFPVVHKLVGTAFFRAMAAEYVRTFPPTSPLLMFYGSEFARFLAGFEPVAALPYLPDMARLELARRCAYHAADADAIEPQALGEIAPEALMGSVFTLHSAHQIIASPYPILSIWQANMDGAPPKIEARSEIALIIRPEFDLEMLAIAPGDAAFMGTLAQGTPLEAAMDQTLIDHPDFDLSEALGLLLSNRLITAITPPKEA